MDVYGEATGMYHDPGDVFPEYDDLLTLAERAEVALATVALQRALYRFVAEPARSERPTTSEGEGT